MNRRDFLTSAAKAGVGAAAFTMVPTAALFAGPPRSVGGLTWSAAFSESRQMWSWHASKRIAGSSDIYYEWLAYMHPDYAPDENGEPPDYVQKMAEYAFVRAQEKDGIVWA